MEPHVRSRDRACHHKSGDWIRIASANNFETATMFVPIVILMVMAIGLNYLIGAVERWVAPWKVEIAGRDE